MSDKNYYEVLKVSPVAGHEAIKKSYQRLARLYHPDKNPNDAKSEEKFKEIHKAYQILSNSFKRKEFDEQLRKEKEKKNKKPASYMYESYHSHIPETNTTPPVFPSTAQPSPPHSPHPRAKNILNSFKDYFKDPTSSSSSIETILEISLEEAFFGCQKILSLSLKDQPASKFSVFVPPGTKPDQMIRMKNLQRKKTKDKFYARVVYKAHPLFKVKEENILMDLPVPFTKAILGGAVEIPTLRGQVVFQLPSGSGAGTLIQLKGQGLMKNAKQRGDMLITVLVDVPSNLSEQEKTWIKNIHEKNHHCPKSAEFNIKAKLMLKKRKEGE